jgi:O-antigen/teichoic acid export membrane protein
MAGNFILRAVHFLLLPLYSQVISTEEFGSYALITAFYTVAVIVYQGGLQQGLSKYYLETDDGKHKKEIFSSILNTTLIVSVVLSVIGILFAGNISQLMLSTVKYDNIIVIVFVSLFAENFSYYLLYLLKTKEQAKQVVIVTSIASLINFLLNVVLVYGYEFGISGIFIAQLVSNLILVILLLPLIKKDYQFYLDKILIKKIFLFSFPIFISGIFSIFVEVADRYLINIFLTKDDVGIYTFSYKIAIAMNLFMMAFRTAWIPRALNLFREGNYAKEYGRIFSRLAAIIIFVFLMIVLLINDIFNFQIGDEFIIKQSYAAGMSIIPFVLLGYGLYGIAGFYSIYPYVKNKSYHFFVSDFIGFIFNILLNIILIPIYGIVGAAIATMVSFLSISVYLYFISRKSVQTSYEYKSLAALVLSGIILTTAGILINIIWLDVILITVFILLVMKILKIDVFEFMRLLKQY